MTAAAAGDARPLMIVLCLIPCLYLAYTDIRFQKLHNVVTLPLLFVGLLFSALFGGLDDCLQGMVLGFIIMFIPWLLQGIGGGDVKLATALGAWFGTLGILEIILIGSLAMFAVGSVRLIKQKRFCETFGPLTNNLLSRVTLPGQKGSIARKLGEVGSVDKLPYGAFLIGAAYIVWTVEITGGLI